MTQGFRVVKAGSRGLHNRELCALLLSVMIAGILILSPAFSSLMNTFVINSTGEILVSEIAARSGSPADIQAAVNTIVAASGGTVRVPAGNFTFNPPLGGTGVTIPFTKVPINIIGAGIGATVLQETMNTGSSTMFERRWGGQNYNGSSVRISGISFIGFVVNETATSNTAISIECTTDFRIDHNSFQDFAGAAIWTNGDTGGTYKLVNRGVIDHNSFDNPYKDKWAPHNSSSSTWSLWGYGIGIVGDYYTWNPNIADYLGQYYPTTTYNSLPLPQPIYIENNNFTRMRHSIAANGGGYYVSRYNYFEKSAPYGQNDAHGSTSRLGTRGMESYSNTFNLTDQSYSGGQDAAIEPRGGGGVAWNNTVILNAGSGTDTVQFGNDGEVAPYDVRNFFIWNNTGVYATGTSFSFNSRISNSPGYIENINYFLRAPNQTLDGFFYTPYTYPHPLTLGP